MKQTNVIFVTFTVLLVIGLLWVLLSVECIDKYRTTTNNNGADILFFFRVPKTGSEMTVMLLQWLQGVNTFRHIRLKNTNYRRLDSEEQEELRRQVGDTWAGSNPIPVSFDRHVHFTDLNSNVNGNKIVYFSAIRDPIERIVSQFYYSRVTPRPGLKLPANVTTPIPMRYLTFEECVDSTDSAECSYVTGRHYDLQIPYFCGHEEHCTELNNVKALEKAINNVKHYFPVVGVLEQLNCTMKVVEAKITPFFKGVQQMYFDELLQPKRNKNYNRPKRQLRHDLEKALKINLTLEYQFYHYVKQRLQTQCRLES